MADEPQPVVDVLEKYEWEPQAIMMGVFDEDLKTFIVVGNKNESI